jgi:hypothetical protein
VFPAQQALGAMALDEAVLEEEGEHPPAKGLGHAGEVAEGDVVEATLLVEAAFHKDPVPVRVVPAEVSPALVGDHAAAEQGLAGGVRVELAHKAGDEAADFGEEVRVEAEGRAQDLGQGESEHTVGQP